jgi:hypothetical protein
MMTMFSAQSGIVRPPRLLGRGEMGAVFEVRDLLLQCTVALKVLEGTRASGLEQIGREVLTARRVSAAAGVSTMAASRRCASDPAKRGVRAAEDAAPPGPV